VWGVECGTELQVQGVVAPTLTRALILALPLNLTRAPLLARVPRGRRRTRADCWLPCRFSLGSRFSLVSRFSCGVPRGRRRTRADCSTR